jgi:hypothetical protein
MIVAFMSTVGVHLEVQKAVLGQPWNYLCTRKKCPPWIAACPDDVVERDETSCWWCLCPTGRRSRVIKERIWPRCAPCLYLPAGRPAGPLQPAHPPARPPAPPTRWLQLALCCSLSLSLRFFFSHSSRSRRGYRPEKAARACRVVLTAACRAPRPVPAARS